MKTMKKLGRSSPNACAKPSPAYLDSFKGNEFEGAAKVQVKPGWAQGKFIQGDEYLSEIAIPNFYFHVMTAYAIMRHAGRSTSQQNGLLLGPRQPEVRGSHVERTRILHESEISRPYRTLDARGSRPALAKTEVLEYGTTMKAPAYLAINPMGKVPAIRHGDFRRDGGRGDYAPISADAFPAAKLATARDQRISRALLSLDVFRRRTS